MMSERECAEHVRQLKSGAAHGSVMFDGDGMLAYTYAPVGVDLDGLNATPVRLSEALSLIEAGASDDAGIKITNRKRR